MPVQVPRTYRDANRKAARFLKSRTCSAPFCATLRILTMGRGIRTEYCLHSFRMTSFPALRWLRNVPTLRLSLSGQVPTSHGARDRSIICPLGHGRTNRQGLGMTFDTGRGLHPVPGTEPNSTASR